uniref:PARP n=1 Tax=Eutreptiella gymnastica TaxID=73025 RepID=A0A7S1IXJ0_9EUGL
MPDADTLCNDAFRNDLPKVQKALETNPALKNQLSTTRETSVLYTAARAGHLDLVKYLVQVAGCDIDRANGARSNGSTPLHGAAFGGHCQVIEFLVQHGATLQKNAFGDSALQDLEIADITDGQREACRRALRLLKEPLTPSTTPAALAPGGPDQSPPAPLHSALAEATHPLAQTSPQSQSQSVPTPAKRPDPEVAEDAVPPAPAAVCPIKESHEQDPDVLTGGITCFESLLSILVANKIPEKGPFSGFIQKTSNIIQSAVNEDTSGDLLPFLEDFGWNGTQFQSEDPWTSLQTRLTQKISAQKIPDSPPQSKAAKDAVNGKRPLEDEDTEAPKAKKAKPKPKPKTKGGAKGQAPAAGGPTQEKMLLNPVSKESIAEMMTAEYTVTEIEKDTEEFWDLEAKLAGCQQAHHEDYCGKRLAEGKKPLIFTLIKYETVTNEVMNRRFERRRAALQKEGKEFGRVRLSFHGTAAEHFPSICKTGLLRFKHPLNPCKEQSDDGYFGSNRKGVYVSRYFEYTLKYANDGEPLDLGQTVKILNFKTLPGRSEHIKKLVGGVAPTHGFHSHSSPNHLEWYLFNEDQLCLEGIMTVKAVVNNRINADDEKVE